MSDTELIKERVDIARLIGDYVPLKRAGANHKGLCPFHHEKTPSFMVSSERRRWHCFGCGKGGDVFTFLEEIEGMEFAEALKFLADRAGVALTSASSPSGGGQRHRLKEVSAAAARFFHEFLTRMNAAGGARDYLKHRELTDDTIDAWRLGFAPEQWDLLTRYLLKKGWGIDDLVAAGLTIRRTDAPAVYSARGYYDRFRGRIMFPICDIHGAVIGFTGRILVETPTSGGKYVNTPQTLIYDKSKAVFGLDRAKQEIRARDFVVMVEGQMDVIACHEKEMKNVVATSGTAMTSAQIQLLKRYSENLAIAFDADAAGMNAAKRGIDAAIAEGMHVRVIRIPAGAGKDPDECIRRDPAVWQAAVEGAEDIMRWHLSKAFADRDPDTPIGRQKTADEMLGEIVRIPYAVERDYWLRELSGRLGVEAAVLREDMKRISSNSKLEIQSSKPIAIPEMAKEQSRQTRLDAISERVCAILLRFPSLTDGAFMPRLREIMPAPLYDLASARYTARHLSGCLEAEANAIENQEAATRLELAFDVWYQDLSFEEAKKELSALVRELTREWRSRGLSALVREIAAAEARGDVAALGALQKRFAEVANFSLLAN